MRIMLPLVPAYAISIHKSQGMTLEKVIVNLGSKEYAIGLTYTAISRCKTFENLAFLPFPNGHRIFGISKRNAFKFRLKQDEREDESDAQLQQEYEFEIRCIYLHC